MVTRAGAAETWAGGRPRVNATPDNWGTAYARQALADFVAWDKLQGVQGVPSSQKLHFL